MELIAGHFYQRGDLQRLIIGIQGNTINFKGVGTETLSSPKDQEDGGLCSTEDFLAWATTKVPMLLVNQLANEWVACKRAARQEGLGHTLAATLKANGSARLCAGMWLSVVSSPEKALALLRSANSEFDLEGKAPVHLDAVQLLEEARDEVQDQISRS